MKSFVILFGWFLILPLWLILPLGATAQGSWNPPDADLSFPRTLMDSVRIDSVRATLASDQIYPVYNLVWDHAHAPIPSGNTTDGERFTRSTIAKEGAFVALMDRKPLGTSVGPLSPAERQQLIDQSRQLLEEINTNVGFQSGWIFYQEWQHRSKELINYLIAYDLLLGAGVSPGTMQVARDSLIAFTGHLYHRAMATYTVLIWQFQFFTFQFNNHSIMTASALGLAAVLLNDHSSPDPDYQPQNWIDAGLWNLDNTLWKEDGIYPRVSNPGVIAGYAEGPAYYEYGFENAYPFMRSLWNFLPDVVIPVTFEGITRDIRNPWYNPDYDSLCAWMIRIRMPNGSEPAIHDSPINFGTSITALSGKSVYNIPNPNHPPTDVMWRTQYIATEVAQGVPSPTLFDPLPDAGSLVFRSSHDPDATFLHLIAKHDIPLSGAKAHHQGDASSFSLMANGELLAVDPGYPGYDQAQFVNQAYNHNLVLVNDQGPLPPVGEAVSMATNTCYIEHTFSVPFLDYGEVATSWFDADITRKVSFPDHRYFLIADHLSSPAPANYTFQLQGNGLTGGTTGSPEGAFIPNFANHEGTWSRDSTSLLVHVTASGGADLYTTSLDSLATGSGQFRPYTKMLVRKEQVPATSFLSALIPYTIAPLDVVTLDAGDEVAALRIDDGTQTDLGFAQQEPSLITIPASVSGLSLPVTGNGTFHLIQMTGNGTEVKQTLITEGDSLGVGSQTYITSDASKTIAVSYDISPYSVDVKGFVSETGWAGIYIPIAIEFHFHSGAIDNDYVDFEKSLWYFHATEATNFWITLGLGTEETVVDRWSLRVSPITNDLYQLEVNSRIPFSGMLGIYSVSGSLVENRLVQGKTGLNHFVVDLSEHASGLYLISMTTNAGTNTIKLIHQ